MRSILRQLVFILLLLPLFSQHCLGETLYERSLALFKAKALKADPGDYAFVVLGDSRHDDVTFRKALRLASFYEPLFILHGGDYSNKGGAEATSGFLFNVKSAVPQVPVFVVMGNHENRSVFAREIGPFDFTLKSKRLGLTLVAVDNSEYSLKRRELDYIESELSSAMGLRFVAMHIPPKTERWSWHTFTEGADLLEQIVYTDKVQALFFSHVHLFDQSEFGGVPAFITGGAGAPLTTFAFPGQAVNHILLVRVKNGKPTYRMVPIPQ
jgi:3',5'-cyclic-AMP phosphodiesterase